MYHFFPFPLSLCCCFFSLFIYLARLLDLNWKQNVHCTIFGETLAETFTCMIPKFFLMPLIFTDFNSNGNFSTGISVGYVLYMYLSVCLSVCICIMIHTWDDKKKIKLREFLCADPHWANTSLNMNSDMHCTNHSAIRVAFSVCLKE